MNRFPTIFLLAVFFIYGCNDREKKKNGFEFIVDQDEKSLGVDDSLENDPGFMLENEHILSELNDDDESEPFEMEAGIHSTEIMALAADSTVMVEALRSVLKTTKTSYELHLQLGNLYAAQKRTADARIEYVKTLELNQQCKQAQLKLANLTDDLKNGDEYFAEMDRLIKRFPNAAYLYKGLADHERRQRKLASSVEHYETAIKYSELDSSLISEYHRTLGMVRSKDKDFQGAAVEYQTAVDYNKYNKYAVKDLHLTQSRIYRNEQKFTEAAQEAMIVLELYPNTTSAMYAYYYSLGMSQKKAGAFGKAVVNFNKVLELMPDAGNVHKQTGICFYMAGNLDDAIFHLKKTLVLKEKDEATHYYLAKAYESKEWIELARDEWRWCKKNAKKDEIVEEAGVHLYLLDYLEENSM